MTPLLGCIGPKPELEPAPLGAPGPAVRALIHPGSVVEFRFFYTPELNDVQTVGPDGLVSLQLVGDVVVAGRTIEQVREDLRQSYGEHLRNPDVNVVVQSYSDRYVLVGGEVNRPGTVPMPDTMTTLGAVLQAGGPDMEFASMCDVVIIREVSGSRVGYRANLEAAFSGEHHAPIYLQPRDIVYVPRSRISQMNQWIDQHINRMVPTLGLNYSADLGAGNSLDVDTRIRRN
ncbi:MAG: polysaccharide export protein [bacterium]|nr:polysaccharide export protein [bacterium]